MEKASIFVDTENVISAIDERLYSSFIEHMGRAVYTGIYEPEHPSADDAGFRRDVMELIRPLRLSHIRYPGGNFLSGYDWRDGIGPKEARPVRTELAWFALETNQVGTDEFLQWCERMGISAMLGVNLGTGSPQEAVNLLEYVNGALPTKFAQKRRENGREQPYGVKLWCLGNEMDGPWQICSKTAEEYGRIACETAKMMKWMDPSIELVACGSSYRDMPTFGTWERIVLKHCYPYVDYISLHQYYQNNDGDTFSFLSRNLDMEDSIREIAAICREARQAQNGDHDVLLSFDEWNVWYHFQKAGEYPPKWTSARPIEEEDYDLTDALLVGAMLNTLIRNADTVKIACLAQLVNVIAPIMTQPGGRAWVQTIYHPFLCASRYGRGNALRLSIDAPGYDCAARSAVPYLDGAAVRNADGMISLFLVNRHPTEALSCTLQLRGAQGIWTKEWLCLDAASMHFPRHMSVNALHENEKGYVLPPFSWNMLRFCLAIPTANHIQRQLYLTQF